MEQARERIYIEVSRVGAEYELPAFLIDGILSSVVAEIRERKNIELINNYNLMREQQEDKCEKTEKA